VECWELDYESKRVTVPDLTAEGDLLDWVQDFVAEVPKLAVVETSMLKERIYVIEEMPGFKGYIGRDENPE
jgi:oligoribonuclease (3'-5' exoribonuclease)